VYISVRLIRYRLIRQFAQFVTPFCPLEVFCSANTSFAVSLLMYKQLVRVGIKTKGSLSDNSSVARTKILGEPTWLILGEWHQFCFGYRLSKHKRLYVLKICGGSWPPRPLATLMSENCCTSHLFIELYTRREARPDSPLRERGKSTVC